MTDQRIWVLVLRDRGVGNNDGSVSIIGAYQTEKIANATMEDQEEYGEDWAEFTVQETILYGGDQ